MLNKMRAGRPVLENEKTDTSNGAGPNQTNATQIAEAFKKNMNANL